MGKKQIKQGPDLDVPPPLPQKELYQRVNFALQASAYLHSLASVAGSSDRKGKRKARGDVGDDGVGEGYVDMGGLAMGNMKATRKMAAHTQLKLDPSIKRGVCRGCGTVLIPGLTSRVRNRPDRRNLHISHTTCLECSRSLSIPSPPVDLACGATVDGPVRRARREKIAKRSKVAFHARERGHGSKGHALWVNDRRVDNWGERADQSIGGGEGQNMA
ncbi:hypothetical protein DB88DRAFT_507720 [Papiliotrema laurentii]|uniref:Uncharacterized protein n=1 Tax=Papiliotrema laurentii TaxID=5418 RepID=A0AAD9FX38_PAPLA|nr:hypothetical protein DB88DRAFT_507720 [Papiliotrema laurentii]